MSSNSTWGQNDLAFFLEKDVESRKKKNEWRLIAVFTPSWFLTKVLSFGFSYQHVRQDGSLFIFQIISKARSQVKTIRETSLLWFVRWLSERKSRSHAHSCSTSLAPTSCWWRATVNHINERGHLPCGPSMMDYPETCRKPPETSRSQFPEVSGQFLDNPSSLEDHMVHCSL